MAIEWNRFWCRVLFKEYIKHYRKMTDEQIVRDVRQSMDDLEDLVADTDSFGSQMVRWSNERSEEPFATAARENGKKGGRPKKNSSEQEEARQNQRVGEGSLRLGGHVTPSRTCRPPRDFEEVKDFIAQNGLDYDDARLWWERNYVERDGIDKDGKPIKNWKGALVNACKAEETKRRTA